MKRALSGGLRVVLGCTVLVCAALVHAHGGVGIPVLTGLGPSRGVILDAVESANLHWSDDDPDDNANLTLLYTPNLRNPELSRQAVNLLAVEDCDPSDAGAVFTGVLDGGVDASTPLPTLEEATAQYCRATPPLGCDPREDCVSWDTRDVPAGNYFILGTLDDHWPDGGGGNISLRTSRGIVRVRKDAGNVNPALLLMQPDGIADQIDTCFRVKWVDDDPDDNATIRLWIVRAFGLGDPILVADGLSEDDLANGFDVDMSGAPLLVDYQVEAEISDGVNAPWRVVSDGYITRYVRTDDAGRRISNDGGCVGPPPAWPNDAGWPRRGDGGVDAGGSRSSSGPSGASGSAAGGSGGSVGSTSLADADAGVSSSGAGNAGASSSSGGSQPPGCRNQASGTGPAWVGLLALVWAGRRLRR